MSGGADGDANGADSEREDLAAVDPGNASPGEAKADGKDVDHGCRSVTAGRDGGAGCSGGADFHVNSNEVHCECRENAAAHKKLCATKSINNPDESDDDCDESDDSVDADGNEASAGTSESD